MDEYEITDFTDQENWDTEDPDEEWEDEVWDDPEDDDVVISPPDADPEGSFDFIEEQVLTSE